MAPFVRMSARLAAARRRVLRLCMFSTDILMLQVNAALMGVAVMDGIVVGC